MPNRKRFICDVAKAAGIDSSGPYTGENDAAALIVLAMQAGNLIEHQLQKM